MLIKKGSYQPLQPNSVVKFTRSSPYDWDFKKGDKAKVDSVLSPYPSCTNTIYLVTHSKTKAKIWVTGDDIIPFDQLDLLSYRDEDECGDSYYEDIIVCHLPQFHQGPHKSPYMSWINGIDGAYAWDLEGNTI